MAQGGHGAFDFNDFKKALPTPSTRGEQGPQKIPALKVLSWNIHGRTYEGTAAARNHLVPRVVSRLNPDVMLLQEIRTQKIVGYVVAQCRQDNNRPLYVSVNAGVETEARILYDGRMFQFVQIINLDDIVEELFSQLEPRVLRGEKEVLRNRVIAVRLKHIATQRDIIFVSFHNQLYATKTATSFCNIVAALANKEPKNTPVVAGVNFNCIRATFFRGNARVPEYAATSRRPQPYQVDFFIYASPANISVTDEEGHMVTAEDIFPNAFPAPNHPFSQIFVGLQQTLETCKDSLDHDPLTCDLNISYS